MLERVFETIRYLLEGFLATLFWLICLALGRKRASALGAFLAPALGRVTRYGKIGRENIELVFPRMSAGERDLLLRRAWQNFGRVMAEYPHLDSIEPGGPGGSGDVKIVGGLPKMDRPTIFFSAHLANWEVMGSLISKMLDGKIVVAERGQNNPWVRFLIARSRRRGRIISVEKRHVLRHFARVLRRGGHIACLIDQRENGETINFLGHKATANSFVAALALRFSARVVPARLERVADNSFIFTLEPPLEIAEGETPRSLYAKMYARIEEWIYQTPEQWLWFHRRWWAKK